MKKTHINYINTVGTLFGKSAHKNNYNPHFVNRGVKFWTGEISFLQKWYMWFEGLVNEEIKPFTSDQIKFLKYFKTIKSKPPNRHSKQYSQLKETQKTLIRYYYIRNYKKRNMLKFEKNKPDSIYHYAKNDIEFGKGRYLPEKFEGTLLEKKLNESRDKPKKGKIYFHDQRIKPTYDMKKLIIKK